MTELEIIQGTTNTIGVVVLNEDGSTYDPATGDTVRLGIKHDPAKSAYDVLKTGTFDTEQNCYVFTLSPADTASLPSAVYGERYWYDVSLQTSGGEFYNIIPPSIMLIYTAVTKVVI